jgi:hypothetical protein
MKNLIIQPVAANNYDLHDLLAELYVDKTSEYNPTQADYERMRDDACWGGHTYFQHKTDCLVLRHPSIADTLRCIAKALPQVRFTTRKKYSGDTHTGVILMQYGNEPFYRAALSFHAGMERFNICSPHINTTHLSHRCNGYINEIKGYNKTTVGRVRHLKNYDREIVAILKKVCKQPATPLTTFEDMCFHAQRFIIANINAGAARVNEVIAEHIGRVSRWSEKCFSDVVRVAAFLALEHVVRGTKPPVIDEDTRAAFTAALHEVDVVRESVEFSSGKIPIQIIKLKAVDEFVLKSENNYRRVAQLPDEVVPQVATLMAVGQGAVYGVGEVGLATPALDINMVVMVPVGTHI